MSYTTQDIANGLRKLGLKQGDMVLARAELRALGKLQGRASATLIQALLDVVGAHGTIIGLAFNKMMLFPQLHKNHIVSESAQPVTGGLARGMVNWPGAVRSKHPTNSFVAIGKMAGEVLADHDDKSTCFHPITKLIEHDGKMILVGCAGSSPGFSTVHLAQEDLGLATKSLLKGLRGAYYSQNGKVMLFRQRDVPTCSMGFGHFYSHYIAAGKLFTGDVGDAYSLLIAARDAYKIEYGLIQNIPKIALCDNPRCTFCRGTVLYNVSDMPRYYLSQSVWLLRKILNSLNRSKKFPT